MVLTETPSRLQISILVWTEGRLQSAPREPYIISSRRSRCADAAGKQSPSVGMTRVQGNDATWATAFTLRLPACNVARFE